MAKTDLENLVARVERIEGLLRKRQPVFQVNPLADSADLLDLGDVKTFLEFELPVLAPGSPLADVGRLFAAARTGVTDTSLRYLDSGGVKSEVTHPPTCQAFHNVDQNANNGAWTTLSMNSESWDTDAMHDNVTNNSRITIVTPGVYLLVANFEFAGNVTGSRFFRFLFDGGADGSREFGPWHAASGLSVRVGGTVLFNLAAAKYVEEQARQDSGGLLAVNGNAYSPLFQALWVAPTP